MSDKRDRPDLDRPARPEDRTATDEAGKKPVQGPENIDKGRKYPQKPPPQD